ncbi:MAG: DedA family protein [Solirubrobacterales bacterium]|nr:DedA family protein [Solirubrobacterales bacterium]
MLGTLAAIVDVASKVGLPLLFVLIAVETMGIPVPGETALITAGIVAGKGNLPIEGVIAVAATAAILGDNVGFLIGRHYGRRLLTAPGPLSRHRMRVIEIGEPFFDRHGPKAVFLGRFISGLRITSAWMAGVSRMHWPIFTFYNAAGGIVWATTFGLLAYYGGEHAESVIHTIGIAGVGAVVTFGLVLFVVLRIRRRRAEALVEGAVARAEAREAARASGSTEH